ncbi:Protein of uncharacterised function (DUF533) [Actinobacillus equuli]|nr:Protein of uncharacterised function (DUF533) [Actinobacillus equuli]
MDSANFKSSAKRCAGISKNAMNGNTTTDKVAKIGGGAAAIGILSMIFGRNGGSSLAKLGSLAAIGSLAYQAYQNISKPKRKPHR